MSNPTTRATRGKQPAPAKEPVAKEPVAKEPAAKRATPAKRAAAGRRAAPAGPGEDAGQPGAGQPGAGQPGAGLANKSVQVDIDLLDKMMAMVGELVVTRNQMLREILAMANPNLTRNAQRLNLITSELQESVMKTRMQTMDHLWSAVPGLVRELSAAAGKQLRVSMEGRETELDRSLLDSIEKPLTALVHNAVRHGIETPQQRLAAGKPAGGTLSLRAYHEGGHMIIEVGDDGAGMDPRRVAETAPGQDDGGLGMVKSAIERVGGTVDVDSTLGVGTTWRLTIPLTLAIIQALTVSCGAETYVIPQVAVHELVYLDGEEGRVSEDAMGTPLYRLRGKLLPLVRLDEVLGRPAQNRDKDVYIAVLQAQGRKFGLVVDRVLNTEEVVVKALNRRFKEIGMYAGATLLGDGKVALILDVTALARRAHLGDGTAVAAAPADAGASARSGNMVRLLIAGVGDRRVAIPLDMVTRLEEFPIERIERTGSHEVVQYRNQILPVIRLAHLLGAGAGAQHSDTSLPVVVYTARGRSVALAVDRILDIVEDVVDTSRDFGDEGLLGSAVIQERVTELLDVRRAILAADPRFDIDSPARKQTGSIMAGV